MKLSAIAAVAENYVIGRDGDLPWKLPADLRWFVAQTRGKPLIFGRKTYESTGYLKGRTNIVVTRQQDYQCDADAIANSIDAALEIAAHADVDEVMILGGAVIYDELMEQLDRLYLTVVHDEPEGDTRFPALDAVQWEIVHREYRPADAENPLDMTFFILDRQTYASVTREADCLLPAPLRQRDDS